MRIGIDDILRRSHTYLMVVVDHGSGRLVWASDGQDRATVQKFFDLLGAERASRQADQRRRRSVDRSCVTTACENATLCLDPSPIVRWGCQALDVVRRWVWDLLRRMDLLGQASG